LQGKEILNEFYPKSFSLKERGVARRISDSGELEKVCSEVLFLEKDVVMRYRAGEKQLLNFLVGEVMRKTGKRADFKVVREILEKLLN
jgi:aspartyl-tRNA(Asn)/glutamyl-tRNA(Gln) amidotransferase subunit B